MQILLYTYELASCNNTSSIHVTNDLSLLIPYFISKELGQEVEVICAQKDKGILTKYKCMKITVTDAKCAFLDMLRNVVTKAKEISVLVLNGDSFGYRLIAKLYKIKNEKGKICMLPEVFDALHAKHPGQTLSEEELENWVNTDLMQRIGFEPLGRAGNL